MYYTGKMRRKIMCHILRGMRLFFLLILASRKKWNINFWKIRCTRQQLRAAALRHMSGVTGNKSDWFRTVKTSSVWYCHVHSYFVQSLNGKQLLIGVVCRMHHNSLHCWFLLNLKSVRYRWRLVPCFTRAGHNYII